MLAARVIGFLIGFVAAILLSRWARNEAYKRGALRAAYEVSHVTDALREAGFKSDEATSLLCQAAALSAYCEYARPKEVERMKAHMPAALRALLEKVLTAKKECVTT